jgi:hypothetical protein
MNIRRLLLPLMFLASPLAWADTLYKCQGADGRTTYTNQKQSKGCEVISQDKQAISPYSSPGQRPKQASPSDFPKVEGEQQKARDNDRRAILQTELANEQRNLDAAKATLADQEQQVLPEERVVGGGINQQKRDARIQAYRDKIALHERNIVSLRRELANLK